MGLDARFRLLPPERPAREVEEEMLARWRDEDLFRQVQDARADGAPWVFFEGPPTANGRPGIHHVFARTIKDLFCRHRAMQGYLVPRKAGWDTHGLPVEIEVEKTLPARLAERGMSDEEIRRCSGKQLIEAYGVEEFNRLCRESVFTYRGDWEKLSERIGYWLDYDDPYVTYSNEYVESVWWALKTLHERGLLYRGHKTLPYCGRCGTALSSHELALGYRDVEDPSVYVALDLTSDGATLPPAPVGVVRRRILVWTTTPWTLPANVALAVHPTLAYVEVRKTSAPDWTLLLAEARAAAVLGEGWEDRWDVVHRLTGAQLEGVRYRRPLDWVEIDRATGDAERIVAEAFVSAEDGTGIVHLAPAFGADDYAAGRRHGLAFVQPVDSHGRFPADVPVVGGRFVKDGDADIVRELESRDVLWKATRFLHSYPHCWRCGTPLLYVARESWFVRTTAYRERMLSRNRRVDWHPESVGQERFGDWLENNIDWAVSRDRYWGTPLPVWVNDADPAEIEVIGSYAELAAKTGAPLGADFDPHKPFIDRYTWPAPSGTGTMRRVPQVIDTWFDSGSMPFAQWHYPFEGHDAFARQYPADFIAEGVDQTRGWFYSLLAIATGLGDALPGNRDLGGEEPVAPYRAVVVNDLVLDANGVKMSKSRGNVVNPWDVVEKHGADAVRLFLVASSQLGMSRKFDESAIHETAARFLVTFKNTYSGMFAQYANFGWSPSDADPAPAARPTIDRWILSRLVAVESEVNARLSVFDATAAARLVIAFIQDDVSNWWVRLNRPRLYDVDSADNRAAFATLHEVLTVSCRLLAPFAPFVSDWVHRELTGTSVHLAPFVREEPGVRDEALEWAMDEIRLLSRLARAAREEAGVKVRQPLATLRCVVPEVQRARVEPLLPLLAAELNVKEVSLVSSADSLVTLEAKPNFRALGRKFGKETPLAAKAVAAFSSEALLAFERGEPLAVTVGHETRTLDADDLVLVRRASGELLVKEEDGRFAAIDPTITPALRREGLARELVSRVQRMRRDAGLAVSDRIRLVVAGGNAETAEAIQEHHDWIRGELLAVELLVRSQEAAVESLAAETVDLDGVLVHVALTREA